MNRLAGLLLVVLLGAPATAAAADADLCKEQGKGKERIAACTREIQSGKLKGEALARAHLERGIAHFVEDDLDRAIADLNEATRRAPTLVDAYHFRAMAWARKGDHDRELAEYDALLKVDPKNPDARLGRGEALGAKGNYPAAIAELSTYIKLKPGEAAGYRTRAQVRRLSGDRAGSIADYKETLRLEAGDPDNMVRLAWALATTPESKLRDGKRAVELARQACTLTHWKMWQHLSTLAAAYAESGDFKQAVEWQEKAIALAEKEFAQEQRQALQLYRAGKPMRD